MSDRSNNIILLGLRKRFMFQIYKYVQNVFFVFWTKQCKLQHLLSPNDNIKIRISKNSSLVPLMRKRTSEVKIWSLRLWSSWGPILRWKKELYLFTTWDTAILTVFSLATILSMIPRYKMRVLVVISCISSRFPVSVKPKLFSVSSTILAFKILTEVGEFVS